MGMLIGASFPNEFEMLKEKNLSSENRTTNCDKIFNCEKSCKG